MIIHHSVSPRDLPLTQSVHSFDRNHWPNWREIPLHTEKNSLWYYISYHFVIAADWSFIQTRWLDEIWHHASNWWINQTSIWICLTWNFDIEEPTKAQYATLKKIIAYCEKEVGHKLELHEHNEYAKKSCPGKNFDLSQLENTLMLFYEKLWNDNYAKVPENERQFKDPKAFLTRIKDLTTEQKLSEITYLIAILSEKK